MYCQQAHVPVNPHEHFVAAEFAEDDLLKGLGDEDIANDIEDFFQNLPGGSPGPISPKNQSPLGSPGMDRLLSFGSSGIDHDRFRPPRGNIYDPQDDSSDHNLLQQPLAMGFYVSTARTGPLPRWFWSSCPHRENTCPVCFKVRKRMHNVFILFLS